jgi:hypothetical protein
MKTLKFNYKDSFGMNCSKTHIHVLSFSVDKDSNLKVTDGYANNWFHVNISKLEVFDEPEEKEFDRYVITDNNQKKCIIAKNNLHRFIDDVFKDLDKITIEKEFN